MLKRRGTPRCTLPLDPTTAADSFLNPALILRHGSRYPSSSHPNNMNGSKGQREADSVDCQNNWMELWHRTTARGTEQKIDLNLPAQESAESLGQRKTFNTGRWVSLRFRSSRSSQWMRRPVPITSRAPMCCQLMDGCGFGLVRTASNQRQRSRLRMSRLYGEQRSNAADVPSPLRFRPATWWPDAIHCSPGSLWCSCSK